MISMRAVMGVMCAAALTSSASMALEGKLLVVDNTQCHYGDNISIVDCATGTKTQIEAGYCWGPVFSPDGTKIAYVKSAWPDGWVVVCNLDGTGKLSIPAGTHPWDMCNLSWADDGYIYWTAKSTDFRRVPATGGAEESYRTFPTVVGISGQEGISAGDVSRNLLRAAGTEFLAGNNKVHALNLSAGTTVDGVLARCNGGISPDGELVCANTNSHDTADIYNFSTWQVQHVISAAAGSDGFTGITFSNISSAHVVYVSEHEPTQAYVCAVATDTSYHICAGQPFDYLPPGTAPSAPVMSLDKATLSFSAEEGSSDPAGQTVLITNAGEGTLADVSTSVSYGSGSSWLAAAQSGSGDSQSVDVSVAVAGLSAGTYSATVTVLCANASPATSQITVSLEITDGPDYSPQASASSNPTFGRSPLTVQFTGSATPYAGRSITGYSWDFGDGQTSTDQNPTHIYNVSGSAIVTRVAVLTVTDDQGDTGTDSVSITVEPWAGYQITSPQAGDVWYIGTTRHIRFTGTNVPNAVLHYQTAPGGPWNNVFPASKGEIALSDPQWGDYPWPVPDDASTQCVIAISEYMNQAEIGYSETFEIRAVTDGDGDGMDDGWEAATFGAVDVADGASDFDEDGILDAIEFSQGSDPRVADGGTASDGGFGLSCAAGDTGMRGVIALLLVAVACRGLLRARSRMVR